MTKPDDAKWTLSDPQVNFAISMRGGQPGVDHLGLTSGEKKLYGDSADLGPIHAASTAAACCDAAS